MDENEFDQEQMSEIAGDDAAEMPANGTGGTETKRGQNAWILLVVGLLVGGLAGFFLYPLVMPDLEANAAPLAGVYGKWAETRTTMKDPRKALSRG